jgi:hypothetical protein
MEALTDIIEQAIGSHRASGAASPEPSIRINITRALTQPSHPKRKNADSPRFVA